MPQLGSGSYPTASTLDADDHIVAVVNGAVQEVPGTVAKTFMLPEGVTDVALHSELTATVLASADSTTGWTATNPATLAINTGTGTETRTEGTGCIRWQANMTNGSISTKCYYTFGTPQSTTGRSFVGLDIAWGVNGGFVARPDFFLVKVADDVALTGNVNTAIIPLIPLERWQTIVVPLDGLTEIKSIGIERLPVANYSSSGSALNVIWIDNVRFPAESRIDQALHSADSVGVVVGGTYSHLSTQVKPALGAGKAVLDLQQSSLSGFNGTIWLDSYYVDPTGATDVSGKLSQVINSAPPGSTVKAKAGGMYRLDSRLSISGRTNVTLDFTDAILFQYEASTKTTDWFAEIVDCVGLTIKGGTYLGWNKRPQQATSLVTVAGTPTNNGSTKELNAQDEEVREPLVAYWNVAPHFSRHLPQQVGRPDDGLGIRNYFQYTLADTNQVANDCVISIYDDWSGSPTYGALLKQVTLTLTGTPTEYTVEVFPTHHRQRLKATIKKATASANTISISAVNPWGKSEYNATYDGASAFRIERSVNTTLQEMWIEGFGGDAIQISETNVHGLTIRRCTSRCCSRQGMSFNQGSNITIENCDIYAPGRSGIDFEPYTNTWVTRNVIGRNLRLYDVVNYGFAMANWARNLNYVLEEIDFYTMRLGAIYGGCRGGTLRNLRSWDYTGASYDFEFIGADMLIDGVWATKAIRTYADTNALDEGSGPVTYTPMGNVLRGVHFSGDGLETKLVMTNGYVLHGASMLQGTQADFTNTSATFGPVRALDGVFLDVHLGEYNRQLPNTFKGPVASSNRWVPDGVNFYDGPAFGASSLSGGSTKGNNLRGIAASVTQGATSKAIAFPSVNVGTLGTNIQLFAHSVSGSLTPSTTYYYRVAPRTRFRGPGTYAAQVSVTLGGSQTSTIVKLRNLLSTTTDFLIEGFTVLRGTTNGGPYTQRCDIIPTGLAGYIPLATDLVDIGTALTGSGIGYSDSNAFSTGSWTGSVDESGYEPDTSYGVIVTPSWLTTVRVTSKTTAGFTIDFGTAAPSGATVDWFLVR